MAALRRKYPQVYRSSQKLVIDLEQVEHAPERPCHAHIGLLHVQIIPQEVDFMKALTVNMSALLLLLTSIGQDASPLVGGQGGFVPERSRQRTTDPQTPQTGDWEVGRGSGYLDDLLLREPAYPLHSCWSPSSRKCWVSSARTFLRRRALQCDLFPLFAASHLASACDSWRRQPPHSTAFPCTGRRSDT